MNASERVSHCDVPGCETPRDRVTACASEDEERGEFLMHIRCSAHDPCRREFGFREEPEQATTT